MKEKDALKMLLDKRRVGAGRVSASQRHKAEDTWRNKTDLPGAQMPGKEDGHSAALSREHR